MSKLFVFDMDGTLLPRSTACLELSKVTGTLPELNQLEVQFASGELDTKMFAQQVHRLWGVLDQQTIRRAFLESSKLKNIDTVISLLSERGDHSCLITMSPDFFAELFYEFGFDYIYASRFPREQQQELDVTAILTPEDKLSLTKKLCEQLGIDIVDVVAFGDSMSDKHLFRSLVHTVAVNGTPELQELARYRYSGDDLYEILKIHNL